MAIIAVLLAIAMPNLLRAKISANEGNAQVFLRVISTGCECFAAVELDYPTSMADLTDKGPPYLNDDYTSGPRHGYNFTCGSLETWGYNCTAVPVTCGITGTKNFTITTGGALASEPCGAAGDDGGNGNGGGGRGPGCWRGG
ncbi:type IV pilin protein [Candidatus Omnitrophota bacterium]